MNLFVLLLIVCGPLWVSYMVYQWWPTLPTYDKVIMGFGAIGSYSLWFILPLATMGS